MHNCPTEKRDSETPKIRYQILRAKLPEDWQRMQMFSSSRYELISVFQKLSAPARVGACSKQ